MEGVGVNTNSSGHFYDYFDTDKKLRTHYESCMNEKLIAELGKKPWKQFLKLTGGWPILEQNEWNNTWVAVSKQEYSWGEHVLLLDKEGSVGSQEYI